MNSSILATVMRSGYASLQDKGRRGWLHQGVPPGGWMDPYSAQMALKLCGDLSANAVVIEAAGPGLDLRMETSTWVGIAGADAVEGLPSWQGHRLSKGQRLRLVQADFGQWTYLAFSCGIEANKWLGSASVNPTAGIGRLLQKGDLLAPSETTGQPGWSPINKRILASQYLPDFQSPLTVELWPAPQTDWFGKTGLDALCAGNWHISPDSNRMGIRLNGKALRVPSRSLASEPVRVGTIQVPPNGQPIVMGPDGPTVGGYPKIGWLAPESLAQLAQRKAGQSVQFSFR